jgi:hypothetical protein
MRFPFGKSGLRKAVERGLANGKLQEELSELGDLKLKSAEEAADVVWGLKQLGKGSANLNHQVYALAVLFQQLDEEKGDAALDKLQDQGIPELVRLYDEMKNSADGITDHTLFVLKILGMYGTVDGTLRIIEAARAPLKPDAYMWTVILNAFGSEHPEKSLLFESLSDPLPDGFIAVSLLDAANAVARGDEGFIHPFDTPQGKEKLRAWLFIKRTR